MPYLSVADGHHLHGIQAVTAYHNQDGELSSRNCGLAAAATALRYRDLFSDPRLASLEERFPPDILFGLFGSSKGRVCEILSAYQCSWQEIKGEDALKQSIRHHNPVLVMLRLPGRFPTGHWMVAYAYDEDHVHLTNYRSHDDRMGWPAFLGGWDSLLSCMIDMDNTGIALR
jgi:hypothetical protein